MQIAECGLRDLGLRIADWGLRIADWDCGLGLRLWVRPPIGLEQLRGVDMGVPLGGAQSCVTEEFLDGPQIGAALEEMRRERMSQRVRADTEARAELRDVLSNDAIHAAGREAPPLVIEE